MSQMNVDPITTLVDGSQLLISTQHLGEGRFKCQLFVSMASGQKTASLKMVHGSEREAPTCREAQGLAYGFAMHLYPHIAGGMNKPPYLIWQGPVDARESSWPVEPHRRGYRHKRS
jgi:hypothetical protein